MPISITPVVPPQGAAPVSLDQVLQPGAVIEARVLAQLDASLARILIANTAIEVTTQTPLVPGTVLRLTVSQAAEGGLQLSAVPAPSAPPAEQMTTAPVASTPRAASQDAPTPHTGIAPDPAQAALVQAMRQAAPRQSGLSPLFADLAAALEQGQLPPPVRAAVAPLLMLRPEMSAGVTAPQLQKALQQSGLFLESSLAAGRAPQTQVPDLKAALIVLRQVLSQWQGVVAPAPSVLSPPVPKTVLQTTPAQATPSQTPPPQATSPSVTPTPIALPPAAQVVSPVVQTAGSPVAAPPLVPDEFIVPLTTPQRANVLTQNATSTRQPAASTAIILAVLQDIERSAYDAPKAIGFPGVTAHDDMPAAPAKALAQPASDTPPPPFRGAAPSAQPVALPGVSAEDAAPAIAHKLLDDVDGALARQTLLQIASLAGQPLQQGQRSEQPRWAFEIPFVTPQGTAVAQFEIARDGKSAHEAGEVKRIWRARFSLNVEPAGPVHAAIALTGERTSVRLWADRPQTIARLRDSASLLSHALREADLDPGDITVGRPPQAPAAAAGQFWNQAS